MVGLAGVMAIETTVAAVTVKVSFPVTPLSMAVIADVPTATEVASPAVLTVATVAVAEPQVTCDEMSFLVLSLYVPVAVNWVVVPSTMLGLAGVMAIDESVAAGGIDPPPPPPPPHATNNPVRISRRAPAGPRRP